jgi:hypothetical protein
LRWKLISISAAATSSVSSASRGVTRTALPRRAFLFPEDKLFDALPVRRFGETLMAVIVAVFPLAARLVFAADPLCWMELCLVAVTT